MSLKTHRKDRIMAKKETKKKTDSKETKKKANKPSIAMICIAIAVIAIFGIIMYFSFKYIAHLNMNKSHEAGPIEEDTSISAVDKTVSGDMYTIPDYSDMITLGEYKGLTYEFDTFDNETYSSVRDQVVDHLLGQVIEGTTYKSYSQAEYDDAYAIADNNVQAFADAYSMEKLDFLTKYYGIETMEDYEKYMKDRTIDYLKVKMTIVQIAKSENMTISDDDIATAKQIMKEENGIETDEDFDKMFTQSDIQFYAIRTKVWDWLYENSTVINNSTATDATNQDAEDN